jgi:hypothetical protein
MRSGTVREVFGVRIDEDALERAVIQILDDGVERERSLAGLAEVRAMLTGFDSPPGMTREGTAAERLAYVITSVAQGGNDARVNERQGAENA